MRDDKFQFYINEFSVDTFSIVIIVMYKWRVCWELPKPKDHQSALCRFADVKINRKETPFQTQNTQVYCLGSHKTDLNVCFLAIALKR